jgi:formylglycine-generating enzyme required for sulfatase activity
MLAMAPATRRAGSAGGWCAVPPGQFVMGSPKAEPCRKAEEEQHTVTLTNSFLLRQTEITRGEFTSLMPKESLPPVY